MSIPRGFALVFADLAAGGWSWRAWTRWSTAPRVVVTVLEAHQYPLGLAAMWADGAWLGGMIRHAGDPVPVAIGARALRPILRGDESVPRWVRPDLDAPRKAGGVWRGDEGSAPADRWAPDIEARVNAGMNSGRGPAGGSAR